MSNQTITVTADEDGQRIDRALASLTGETRSAIARAIRQKQVYQEGKELPITKNAITVHTGEVFLITPAPPAEPMGDSIPVNFDEQVIFEDDAILVLNKRAGQVVHPSAGQTVDTIAQAIVERDPTIAEARYDDTPVSVLRPGIVHRLDKATSGIIVIAKTKEALLNLQQQFKQRTIKKEYAAIVYGTVTQPFTVDAPIGRHPINRQRQAVTTTGKEAQTVFLPQKSGKVNDIPLTHLIAQPVTGRTHQIRVHLAHSHHHILGDPVYQTKTTAHAADILGVHNLLLHAQTITLHHPLTTEILSYTAPLPSYFVNLLDAF